LNNILLFSNIKYNVGLNYRGVALMTGIYKIGEWIFDMIILTLLWAVTVLIGIGFTIGPATVACYSVCLKMIKGEEGAHIVKDYIYFLKNDFKKSFITSIAILIFIYVFWFYYSNKSASGIMVYSYGLIGFIRLIFAFILLSTLVFTLPMISYYKAPLKRIVASSFLISTSNLLITIVIYVLIMIILLAIKFTNGFAIIFSIGVYCYLSMLMVTNVFEKHCK